jgi:hypothetical protein
VVEPRCCDRDGTSQDAFRLVEPVRPAQPEDDRVEGSRAGAVLDQGVDLARGPLGQTGDLRCARPVADALKDHVREDDRLARRIAGKCAEARELPVIHARAAHQHRVGLQAQRQLAVILLQAFDNPRNVVGELRQHIHAAETRLQQQHERSSADARIACDAVRLFEMTGRGGKRTGDVFRASQLDQHLGSLTCIVRLVEQAEEERDRRGGGTSLDRANGSLAQRRLVRVLAARSGHEQMHGDSLGRSSSRAQQLGGPAMPGLAFGEGQSRGDGRAQERMAEPERQARGEEPRGSELVRGLGADGPIDAGELARELELRVVAENDHRVREVLLRRIEPHEPRTSNPRDLRRGDLSDPLDAMSGERDILGT